ncbi:HAD family hydrolase [Flavobacterium agrisoli]|uniref:Uncharacterized protein n=1 Tax=Flavobacterium agrisoli TaxID=2793066 RepID=A0A934PQL4_9FLAO|nr:hypothetical protein [Flavobacterium agrisoli]MBK0371288.1 hypothetical protein [Flavobacterium agrisoli]
MEKNKLTRNNFILCNLFSTIITFLYIFKVPVVFVGVFSILIMGLLYFRFYKKINFDFFLLLMLVYTLPFSFISILGESFLSLFVIIQLILTLYLFGNGKYYYKNISLHILCLISLFFILIVYTISQNINPDYYFESLIKILLFILMILVVSTKAKIKNNEIDQLLKAYVISAFISGLAVLTQYLFFKYLGRNDIGLQSEMGATRLGFAGLFYDYSISSVFIASSTIILIHEKINKKILFTKYIDIALMLFLIFFSVLTSARTGIASLFVVFCILLIYFKKIKWILLSVIIALPVGKIILFIFEENRGTDLSNDSGRLANYLDAIVFFQDNFLFGAKFLGYFEISHKMLAHNFLLDFLVQYGAIFSIVLIFIFAYILVTAYKIKPVLFFLFLLMIVGGNFHASFLNTHYIMIPIILILALKNYETLSCN